MSVPFPLNPAITLRDHQASAWPSLMSYWRSGKRRPIMDWATGGGKSMGIGEVTRQILNQRPGARVGVFTLTKELVSQDEEDMKFVCDRLPVGVNMASLRRREYRSQVLIGSIQSTYNQLHRTGGFDVVHIDECHLAGWSDEETSMFYKFFEANREICPRFEVIGWTATPWRGSKPIMGWEKAIFGAVAHRLGIGEAIKQGYLVPPVAVPQDQKVDTSQLKMSKTTGDFTDKSLSFLVDDPVNQPAVERTIYELTHGGRNSNVTFCASVAHAEKVAMMYRNLGMHAEVVHGSLPKAQREKIVADFRAGKFRVLVNCQVLLIGFDHKALDLITVLRPTQSSATWLQLVGRGLRCFPGKENCLVLDWTDNSEFFGPIDLIKPPAPPPFRIPREDEATFKECNQCLELVPMNTRVCPHCNHEFSPPPVAGGGEPDLNDEASSAQLLSTQEAPKRLKACTGWFVAKHQKPNRPDSLRIDYFNMGRPVASEWLALNVLGPPRDKACQRWHALCGEYPAPNSVAEALDRQSEMKCPTVVELKRDGKWERVVGHDYRSTT